MENNTTRKSTCKNNVKTISEKEENYVRMSLLLSRITPRAVRVLYDSEFDPTCLEESLRKAHTTLKDMKTKRIINQSQWNLLFPFRGVPNSKTFDVTLMITLLVNLTELDHYDKLPLVTDTLPSADLGRIKYYRNHISHNTDGEIDNLSFSSAWNDITEAVGRLGGKQMIEECKTLMTTNLNQSTVPWHIRELMPHSHVLLEYEIALYQVDATITPLCSNFHYKYHKMDTVQINDILETWKSESSSFVETRAAKQVLECIQANSCVTITASSGVGKTAILQYVALQMENKGYDILVVTSALDIVNFYNPNKKSLFVIDDFCGTYSIEQTDLRNLETVLKRIELNIQNKLMKIIVACRLQVFQDEKFESLSIFRKCVCNLLSKNLCLSKLEKQSIAECYLKNKTSDIMQFCDQHDFFPLLCKLYQDNPKPNIKDFFESPFSVYKKEIQKLHTKGRYTKYCALALCVMFNNRLKQEWFTDEINKNIKTTIENTCTLDRETSRFVVQDELSLLQPLDIRTIIENTCQACKLDRGTSRLILLDELKSLTHTFIKKEQGVFKTKHDKIFDFLVFFFGKQMMLCIILNADTFVISNRFLLEIADDMEEFITIVPSEYHDMYICRMIDDWSKGKVSFVSMNINMKVPEFRKRFLCYLETLDISFQRKLAHTCDAIFKDTILVGWSEYDDIQLIQWCIHHDVDVNKCNVYGHSPLIVSSQAGHSEIVKILLKNKANINVCANYAPFPLFTACVYNHIDTVKVLLDNKADVDKCSDENNFHSTSLIAACHENFEEIVKLLLEYGADINKCAYGGVSPVFVACQKNHIEIFKILLDYKADINKCLYNAAVPLNVTCEFNDKKSAKLLSDKDVDLTMFSADGISPLFIASQFNHVDIVKILLTNNVDVNKCMDNGMSPLCIACYNNNIEIVKVLLDNKADINNCLRVGASPLFVACKHCHIEIVKVLLNNKADIDKCMDDGTSPLYIVCQNNNIEIVKILLNNKADINKCVFDGTSPLHTACHSNNIEIVKVLLENEADINKCTTVGKSPLYTACQKNHLKIVKLLLDKKADTNKCTNKQESPLHVACQNNQIDMVKVLLDNKADINKCTYSGVSPLRTACYFNNIEIVKILLHYKAELF